MLDKCISIFGFFIFLKASSMAIDEWVNAAGLIINPSYDLSTFCILLINSPSLFD